MIIASTMILSPINAESFNNIMRSQSYSIDCMASEKCIDGVKQIKSISDISNSFPNVDYSMITAEVNVMLDILKRIKVKVFLADQKYFPVRYRGIYSTKRNNFYINKRYANNPRSILFTMRHEGWHVAQDCKAGINNKRLEIILNEKYIPQIYRDYVEKVYTGEPDHIPFEKGAFWASVTKDVTQWALDACYEGSNFYFHVN